MKKNLTVIGIRDGETVALQDRDRYKYVCVTVMDLNGLKKKAEEEEESGIAIL